MTHAAGTAEFPYHRGLAPILWPMGALSSVESVAVHLLVALRWPAIGWALTAISAAGLVWLALWIRSMARLPHRLADGVLHLHAGSLKHQAVPIDAIADIAAEWPPGAHNAKDAANFAVLAHPNRVVHLNRPLRRRRRFFIRLDDPTSFDVALAQALTAARAHEPPDLQHSA